MGKLPSGKCNTSNVEMFINFKGVMHEMISFLRNFGNVTKKLFERINEMRNICQVRYEESSKLNLEEEVSNSKKKVCQLERKKS